MATETTVWACKNCGRCGITEQCSCGGTRAQLAESDARRRFMEAYEPETGWYDDAELTREWRKAEDRGAEDIQRRCRASAERFEALAGPARVDAVVSADLLLEAASLLRGYHQCLLVETVLGPDPLRKKAKSAVPHTPGLWVVDSNGPGHEVVLARGGSHAVAVVQGTDDPVENLANAHLIATAPELRELAKEASEIMQITYAGNFPAGIESFLVRAERVIAKAEGR